MLSVFSIWSQTVQLALDLSLKICTFCGKHWIAPTDLSCSCDQPADRLDYNQPSSVSNTRMTMINVFQTMLFLWGTSTDTSVIILMLLINLQLVRASENDINHLSLSDSCLCVRPLHGTRTSDEYTNIALNIVASTPQHRHHLCFCSLRSPQVYLKRFPSFYIYRVIQKLVLKRYSKFTTSDLVSLCQSPLYRSVYFNHTFKNVLKGELKVLKRLTNLILF